MTDYPKEFSSLTIIHSYHLSRSKRYKLERTLGQSLLNWELYDQGEECWRQSETKWASSVSLPGWVSCLCRACTAEDICAALLRIRIPLFNLFTPTFQSNHWSSADYSLWEVWNKTVYSWCYLLFEARCRRQDQAAAVFKITTLARL